MGKMMIAKHLMDGVRFTEPVRAADDIKFLTRDEQRVFLETAKRSRSCDQYALILEAGLRIGEMIGLTWDAIDFENRTLTVSKLRHTCAARAVEGGMQPKVLQKLLGHASIKTTMDRYVHVTDSSMADAVRLFGALQLESA